MKKIILVVVLFTAWPLGLWAQSRVIVNPAKPITGRSVRITYVPAPNAPLRQTRSVALVQRQFEKDFERYPMKQQGNVWEASIFVPKSQRFVLFYVESDGVKDTNGGRYWDFVVSDEAGLPLRSAFTFRAASWKDRTPDAAEAERLRLADLQAEREAHPNDLILKLQGAQAAGTPISDADAQRWANAYWQREAHTYDAFSAVYYFFQQTGKTQLASDFLSRVLAEDSSVSLQQQVRIRQALEGTDPDCSTLIASLKDVTPAQVSRGLKYRIYNRFAGCKYIPGFVQWAKYYAEEEDSRPSTTYRGIANHLLNLQASPETAVFFIQKALELEPKEVFSDFMRQDSTGTWLLTQFAGETLRTARENLHGENLKISGRISMLLGRYVMAYDAFERAKNILKTDQQLALWWGEMAEQLNNLDAAYRMYQEWALKTPDNTQALEHLKALYTRKHKGLEGWDQVMTTLQTAWATVSKPVYTVEKYDPKRNPAQDLAETAVRAQSEHKRILLFVGGEWCSWCHALARYFRDTPSVAQVLQENYLIMKVNYSEENENKPFLDQYPEIQGYPHLFVLDEQGQLLHSQDTGNLEEGVGMAYNEKRILDFLGQWKKP